MVWTESKDCKPHRQGNSLVKCRSKQGLQFFKNFCNLPSYNMYYRLLEFHWYIFSILKRIRIWTEGCLAKTWPVNTNNLAKSYVWCLMSMTSCELISKPNKRFYISNLTIRFTKFSQEVCHGNAKTHEVMYQIPAPHFTPSYPLQAMWEVLLHLLYLSTGL